MGTTKHGGEELADSRRELIVVVLKLTSSGVEQSPDCSESFVSCCKRVQCFSVSGDSSPGAVNKS